VIVSFFRPKRPSKAAVFKRGPNDVCFFGTDDFVADDPGSLLVDQDFFVAHPGFLVGDQHHVLYFSDLSRVLSERSLASRILTCFFETRFHRYEFCFT
jgi:hypothetical protein